MIKIKSLSIIGANGTMGKNIAELFATLCKDITIYLICRDYRSSILVKDYISNLICSLNNNVKLIPKAISDIGSAISNSELVFECVPEDLITKNRVLGMINEYLTKETIIASGTSSLSINEMCMSIDIKFRENFIGIHLFNPPNKMKLCELIPSNLTNQKLVDNLVDYLESILLRKVVIVKDQPGFLANRIGFQILNEALQFSNHFKEYGGIDYIDQILGKHTGRIMSPCVTIDYIGLDIHKLIVDNIFNNSNDFYNMYFKTPDFLDKLVSNNCLGRKTNIGLYKVSKKIDGYKEIYVYDIVNNKYRLKRDYKMPFIDKIHYNYSLEIYSTTLNELLSDTSQEAQICSYFLIKYCIYSIYIAKSSLKNVEEVDDVMKYGFNWIPPLALLEAYGGIDVMKIILTKKFPDIIHQSEIDNLLSDLPRSKYSYKDYLI